MSHSEEKETEARIKFADILKYESESWRCDYSTFSVDIGFYTPESDETVLNILETCEKNKFKVLIYETENVVSLTIRS